MIPEQITSWAGWAGMAIVTMAYFFFPLRRKEIDSATATLVETLSRNVKALQDNETIREARIVVLESTKELNEKRIKFLEDDNTRMVQIFQGRDETTLKAIKDMTSGFAALQSSLETNNALTSGFVKTVSEHFLTVEDAAINKK